MRGHGSQRVRTRPQHEKDETKTTHAGREQREGRQGVGGEERGKPKGVRTAEWTRVQCTRCLVVQPTPLFQRASVLISHIWRSFTPTLRRSLGSRVCATLRDQGRKGWAKVGKRERTVRRRDAKTRAGWQMVFFAATAPLSQALGYALKARGTSLYSLGLLNTASSNTKCLALHLQMLNLLVVKLDGVKPDSHHYDCAGHG